MCLWKNEINDDGYENVFQALIEKRLKINDLDFEKAIHRKAAYNYIKLKPNNLTELKSEKEKEFLRYIVKRDYKLFLYLEPEQYEEEIAQYYLECRLQDDKNTATGFLSKSFDESLVFSMYYDTRDGEQIFYYDKDIHSTTFLVSRFDISFKVSSVVDLFKKLDVSISMFGFNILFNELMCWINKEYRKTIIKFITTKEVGVYNINALYDEIEKETIKALNNSLNGAGIAVQKMSIQKLSISENATRILEKEGLDRIKEKIKREAELEYESQALDNYAKKAKIHKENPNFELTLTEAEKDFALDRYITKNLADNGQLPEIEIVDELADRTKKVSSTTLKKVINEPTLQEEKAKKSAFLYIPAVMFLFVGLIVLVSNVALGIGLSFFIIGILFLCGAIFQSYKYKKESTKITPRMQEEYEAKMEEFNEKSQQNKK